MCRSWLCLPGGLQGSGTGGPQDEKRGPGRRRMPFGDHDALCASEGRHGFVGTALGIESSDQALSRSIIDRVERRDHVTAAGRQEGSAEGSPETFAASPSRSTSGEHGDSGCQRSRQDVAGGHSAVGQAEPRAGGAEAGMGSDMQDVGLGTVTKCLGRGLVAELGVDA